MTAHQWTGGVQEAAAEWHRNGYRLAAWPARYGKGPRGGGWGLQAADPASVGPDDNIGCNHALSGTVCVDVDHMRLSVTVLEFLGLDLTALEAATLAYTGRPDRVKLLFRAPAGPISPKKLTARLQGTDTAPTTIIELRGAEDGKQAQDVLPPSRHPDTGQPYVMLTAMRRVDELAELPPALVDVWRNWTEFEPVLRRLVGDVDAIERDRKGKPKRENHDVIGQYNARFTVGDVLERNGYVRLGGKRWLRPESSTGTPGVVLLPAGDAVWSHGGGALADDRPHDAFDVFRILEHRGEMRDAVRAAADALGITRAANDDDIGAPTSGDSWPVPGPLPDRLLPVEPFDPALLPDALRPFIVDVADRMQCPVDYPAVVQMTVLGAMLGRRVGIQPKRHDDWYVVPNLWGFIVGRPSMMKSPVISAILEPVRTLEAAASNHFERASASVAVQRIIQSEQQKAAQRAVRKAVEAGDDEAAAARARGMLQDDYRDPKLDRLTTSDATVEKLGELLSENPNGLLLLRDELTGFFRTFERQGHEGDRAFYLECWNGTQPYTTDRIGRGTVHVPAACVSILGGIQPGPLSALVREMQGTGDDGLLQRFQMVTWPDQPPGFEIVDRTPDRVARGIAASIVTRFANLRGPVAGAIPGPVPLLKFDDEAQDAFLAWLGRHERRTRAGDMHPAVESHLTKYRSLVPSLALIIHLCDHAGGPVRLGAVQRALRWAAYLESHARRMYSPAMRPDVDAAHALAERIRNADLAERFTARDAYGNDWSGLTNTEHTKAGLRLLCERHWLRQFELQTAGRPSVVYVVNPALRRRAAA